MTGAGTRATRLAHAGRDVPTFGGKTVNPPLSRASTILFDDLASLSYGKDRRREPDFIQYGRFGTETHTALRKAWSELEGADDTLLLPCGLAANVLTLLAFVESGDHVLMIDNVYAPARGSCDGLLAPLGVETTYFDPQIGAGIEELIRPNTRLIYLETPRLALLRALRRAGLRRGRPAPRHQDRARQHLGHPAVLPAAGAGRRRLDPGRHQVSGRPFGCHARPGRRQRRDVPDPSGEMRSAGLQRGGGRGLSGAARLPHARRPSAPA